MVTWSAIVKVNIGLIGQNLNLLTDKYVIKGGGMYEKII